MKKVTFSAIILLTILLVSACGNKKGEQIGSTQVLIETSMGDITLRLYDDTPLHRDNFIKLVHEGVFDNLIWHRIVPEGTIQSGDPTLKVRGAALTVDTSKYNYTVPAEILYPRHFHKPGALCMARQPDSINVAKASSSTQFYIVTGKVYSREKLAELHQFMNDQDSTRDIPNFTEQQKQIYTTRGGCPHLDGDYTVFGEVVDGMRVVEAIGRIKVDERERPLKEVSIKRIVIE